MLRPNFLLFKRYSHTHSINYITLMNEFNLAKKNLIETNKKIDYLINKIEENNNQLKEINVNSNQSIKLFQNLNSKIEKIQNSIDNNKIFINNKICQIESSNSFNSTFIILTWAMTLFK